MADEWEGFNLQQPKQDEWAGFNLKDPGAASGGSAMDMIGGGIAKAASMVATGGMTAPADSPGFMERAKKGFSNYPGDVADIFMEGVHQVTGSGPSQFEDIRGEVEKQLLGVGRTPDEAKRETEWLMESWRRQERMSGVAFGAMQAITSPLLAAGRSFGSRPLEEATGVPKEVSETFGMVGLAALGMRPMARVKIDPAGKVTAQAIGEMPKDADFKTAAELVSGGKDSATAEANLRTLWEERGIHPAEAFNDAQSDVWVKNELTKPSESSERIVGAAVISEDGRIFSGQVHSMAAAKAEDAGAKLSQIPDDIDGFLTSTGRYVSRKEAAQIANAAGQTKEPVQSLETSVMHGDYANVGQLKVVSADEMLNLRPDIKRAHEPFYVVGPNNRLSGHGSFEQAASFIEETTGQRPHSLGADVTRDPPLVPLAEQPAPRPGIIVSTAQRAVDTLMDIGRDIQMKVAPMATGTMESIAAAKDFANGMRRNRWEWARIDDDIAKRFDPEQRKRMWDAADEESVLRQEGDTSEHMGLATLEPAERVAVEDLHTRAQTAWLRARDIGLVEGEGLPAYTPRMVLNTANAVAENRALPLNSIGANLKTSTPNLRHRKHMTAEETEAAAREMVGWSEAMKLSSKEDIEKAIAAVRIARDIRSLPLATAKLEDAVAGRTLINNIKDAGKAAGEETVVEGAIPAGSDQKWFTLDHPAFRTWRPKFETVEGATRAVKDAEGNTVFEQVPLYVRGDYEGPLRAVLNTKSSLPYTIAMDLKGKTMSMIMYSPAIHNMVEFGRAFPAMPLRIFKAYFDGNRAKNDLPLMREAIDNGLVPIGKRFFKQDIDAIMEAPDLTPGRSWTAKILAAVPGLFDEGAGTAVKRAVDKAGDFWHNTLLWDRVADLQMGIYTNLRGDLLAKGVDPQTSSRMAAHFANRYAGALPQEAMSAAARKTANMLLFSRTFTMGNLGVMKDMITGMPKDVVAQIERDMGTVNPEAAGYAKALARRKAISTVMLDIGLMYVGNSVLQSAFNVMLGDRTLDEESHGYAQRFRDVLNDAKAHPLSLLQPFSVAEKLSSTSQNEPGRKDRIKIGNTKDGTGIYARNPVGKIGEEFIGFMTSPLDMLKRKEGTIARPMFQIMSNDKGFGRKVYDPQAETPLARAGVIWAMVEHFAKAQTPEGQINAFSDLVRGEGDPKVNTLQTLGPFAGVTFSKGAPGGPAVGEFYDARQRHDFQVNLELPDIRRQIQRGDLAGARERMTELGVPRGLQNWYVKTTINPATRVGGRSLMDFYRYATPEQRDRLDRARSGQ